MTIKILLPFLTTYFHKLDFLHPLQLEATYHSRSNAEADESPLAPIKPDIKEIGKSIKRCHSESYRASTFLFCFACFGKYRHVFQLKKTKNVICFLTLVLLIFLNELINILNISHFNFYVRDWQTFL